MWRFTRFGSRLGTLRMALFSAAALTVLNSCSDTTAPTRPLLSTSGIVPLASFSLPAYNVDNTVPFTPDTAPTINASRICEDCFVDRGLSIGFSFTFFGNVYDKINISSNGIVGFGPLDANGDPVFQRDGCCTSGFLPKNDVTNNVIALGWADWSPNSVKQIRHQMRGTAPNRRFVIQYTGVGEGGGNGHLTAQLILYEHSNDIVIYTTELNTTFAKRTFTQGIENLAGDEARFVAGRDSARFSLANDAVRFSMAAKNQAPFVTPPSDILANTGAGVCAATLSVGTASSTDDAPGVTVAGVRSDKLALDAAYPKGVTTIMWTATDAEGLTANAPQTVTVSDKENPVMKAPANITVRSDKGVGFAKVDIVPPTATDNCPNVTVTGTRDDAPLTAGYPTGVTTITWTAKDESGNVTTAKQTVTVRPNVPPVLTYVPPAITVSTDAGVCVAKADPGLAKATDDLDGVVVTGVRNDALPLNSPYPKGVTIITWTATDVDQAAVSATQNVTVSDKEKPTVSPANISTVNQPSHNYAAVVVNTPSAKDNCPGDVKVVGSRSDGQALDNVYPVGVTTITWAATDASGNSASAPQTVTVSDNEPPTLVVPADFELNATMPSGALVTYLVSANDNVGVTSISCNPASGSVFAIGYKTVTCVARDAAGNSASKEFGVEVIGAQEQMNNLLAWVRAQGYSNGTENPLLNQLRAALAATSPSDACTKLDDFIHLVLVKSREMGPAAASSMTGAATNIKRVLGCTG
jgi:hypothetical protein